MRHPKLDWIIILCTAFLFMMLLLSSPIFVEGMDTPMAGTKLNSHSDSRLAKNFWRSKRRGAHTSSFRESVKTLEDQGYGYHSKTTNLKSDRYSHETNPPESRRTSSWLLPWQRDNGMEAEAKALSLLESSNLEREGAYGKSSEPSPEFVFVQPIVVVHPNSLATLPCSVKNLGEREVVWRNLSSDGYLTIGKMVWNSDPRVLVEYKLREDAITSWDLLIKSVRPSDAGTYECQVTSSERVAMNVELRIVARPTTMKPHTRVMKKVTQRDYINTQMEAADQQQRHPQKEEYITAGMPIKLSCKTPLSDLDYKPSIQTKWYKDGLDIASNKHILLTRYKRQLGQIYVNELYISKTTLGDTGEYHCLLQNKVIDAVMIYVLPNTTIGSEMKDSSSTYYSVGSLKTENGAALLPVSWHTSWLSFVITLIFPCFLSLSLSSYLDFLALVFYKTYRIIDQT